MMYECFSASSPTRCAASSTRTLHSAEHHTMKFVKPDFFSTSSKFLYTHTHTEF